jgi:hypothetical protein
MEICLNGLCGSWKVSSCASVVAGLSYRADQEIRGDMIRGALS